jgi:hypothetical protein
MKSVHVIVNVAQELRLNNGNFVKDVIPKSSVYLWGINGYVKNVQLLPKTTPLRRGCRGMGGMNFIVRKIDNEYHVGYYAHNKYWNGMKICGDWWDAIKKCKELNLRARKIGAKPVRMNYKEDKEVNVQCYLNCSECESGKDCNP